MSRRVRTHVHVRIEAPRELVWRTLSDLELQPLWLREARAIEVREGDTLAVGARLDVPARLLGIPFTDTIEVTEHEAPKRWAVNHVGPVVHGHGEFRLVTDDGGDATIVYWTEEIDAPLGILGEFALTAVQPVIRRRFEADLHRLRRLVESESRRSESR